MKRFWRVACWATIAGCVVFMITFVILNASMPRVEELRHTLWRAGAVSNSSANDIWIEYGSVSGRVSAIYRDYDGDGFVDECLMFSGGPLIAVLRASSSDGRLDVMRDIRQPMDRAEQLSLDAPEAGPFTRAQLDELSRIHPIEAGDASADR